MAADQGYLIRKAYLHAFVELLARENPKAPIRIVEIGSWAGASSVVLARAIKEFAGGGQVICIDPWKPYFDLEINRSAVYREMQEAAETGDIYRLFLHNIRAAGVDDIIQPMVGKANEVLPQLPAGEFDLVFIDGSHAYNMVLEDISKSQRLIRDHGILCGDDLELALEQVDQKKLRVALNRNQDYVKDPKTGLGYHPGVTQAVADTLKNQVGRFKGLWAARRNGDRWEPLSLGDIKVRLPEAETIEGWRPSAKKNWPTMLRRLLFFWRGLGR